MRIRKYVCLNFLFGKDVCLTLEDVLWFIFWDKQQLCYWFNEPKKCAHMQKDTGNQSGKKVIIYSSSPHDMVELFPYPSQVHFLVSKPCRVDDEPKW